VRLKFSDDALRSIAREAMNRKVGARGLRMILEELMLDLMYHLPSQKKVKEFEVTRDMVEKRDVSLTMMEKAG
jgi:ATP-dependent Clp protease ATP-binding subunit ClpX